MFSYIKGKLVSAEKNSVVIETGGVGWLLSVSDKTAARLSSASEETVTAFTYLSVREDAMELFGFYDKTELEVFKLLIAVSGIGPKGLPR